MARSSRAEGAASARDPGMRSVAFAAIGVAAVSVLLSLFVAWQLIEARRALDRQRAACRCCDAAMPMEVPDGR